MLSVLTAGLYGLDLVETGLAQRAANFVASGDDAAVLAHLATLQGAAGAPLGAPGQLAWHLQYAQSADGHAASLTSRRARHQLYQATVVEPGHVALLVRLGKVLAAADMGQALTRTMPGTPDWLQYLLNDALGATLQTDMGDIAPHHRAAWDVTLLAALLAADDQPPALLLPIVFERQQLHRIQQPMVLRSLLAPGALDTYLAAHPAEVAAAVATLSPPACVLLVQRLGSQAPLLATFAELVLQLAVGDSKVVRTAAAQVADAIDPQQARAVLTGLLRSPRSATCGHAADLLARLHGDAARPVLEAALATAAGKAVQQAIRVALGRLSPTTAVQDLPAPPPLPPAPHEVLAADALDLLRHNRVALLALYRQGADDEIEQNRQRDANRQWPHQQQAYASYSTLTDAMLAEAIDALNGQAGAAILGVADVEGTLHYEGRLAARADFGLLQMLRQLIGSAHKPGASWRHPLFQQWLARQDLRAVDLRQLVAQVEQCGGNGNNFATTCLYWNDERSPQQMLPADRVWPLFAERTELIDVGLGLAPAPDWVTSPYYHAPDLQNTLSVLATFPAMPERWMPRLLELALGENKADRHAVRQALARVPGIALRVAEALASSQQEVRIEAARWLAALNDRAAIPALQAALDQETRETVTAALLDALEHLGVDIGTYLAPDKLLAQARKGLKARPPASMAWLDLAAAPPCTWRDGAPVAADIVRWWVIFACKLKEPAGSPMLERYLDLLAPASRAALGRWLLQAFIARDTQAPSLDEASAWAQANVAQRQQLHHDYYQWIGQQPPTPEQVYETLKREKLATYPVTAINEKGMLALIAGVPGRELADTIAAYMRDHYVRRAQVEALLEAASNASDAAVIQLVLGVARRHRTASVQEKARLLVQRIADRNGWTQDQLADRTVPTGGLDDDGRLALSYGSRSFTLSLDAALKPVLRNDDGAAVADLPAPRQDDDAEAAKQAKQLFNACKKEVKQVVALQTARLHEAMCAGRIWPAAEWRTYLLRHPLVGRLAQRLVWQEVDTGTAALLRQFRPTEDGELIDIDDNPVTLDDAAGVRLAHRVWLNEATAKAWTAHLADYKVAPLFAQLKQIAPVVRDSAAIDDRLGWFSDSYKLRNAFTKRGYHHAPPEDGPHYFAYHKDVTSAGLSVAIDFSGASLTGENAPAALKTLSFRRLGQHRYDGAAVPLQQVPPVLLAEAYGDYLAVAAAGTFDPDWEKKVPW